MAFMVKRTEALASTLLLSHVDIRLRERFRRVCIIISSAAGIVAWQCVTYNRIAKGALSSDELSSTPMTDP